MAFGGAWLGFAESYWSAFLARLVSGIGGVLLNVLVSKMIADWFGGRDLALAMAFMVTSWPISLGLALVLVGPVAAGFSTATALGLSGLVSAVALLVTAALYPAECTETSSELPNPLIAPRIGADTRRWADLDTVQRWHHRRGWLRSELAHGTRLRRYRSWRSC